MALTAQQIADAANVTPAYARMILAGARVPSTATALAVFDATGELIGPLQGMNEDGVAVARQMERVKAEARAA